MSKRNGDKAKFNRLPPAITKLGLVIETFDSDPAAVSSFAPLAERIEDAVH